MLYNLVPRMLSDIRDSISLSWIRIQDARYQILSLFREERGHLVLSFDNLLVQFLCLLIFKGQITADHGV